MISSGATLFRFVFVCFSTCPAAAKPSNEMQSVIDQLNLLQEIQTPFVVSMPKLEIDNKTMADLKSKLEEKHRCIACSYLLSSVYYLKWIREIFHSEDEDMQKLKPHLMQYSMYETIACKMLATLINIDYSNSSVIEVMWIFKFHVEWLSINQHRIEDDINRDVFWSAHDAVTALLEESVAMEDYCSALTNKQDYQNYQEIRARGKCATDITKMLEPIIIYKEMLNVQLEHNEEFCKISKLGHGWCFLDSLCMKKPSGTFAGDMDTLLKFGMVNDKAVWSHTMLDNSKVCTSLNTQLHSVIRSVIASNHDFIQLLKGIMISITWKYLAKSKSTTWKWINKKIPELLREFTDFLDLNGDTHMKNILELFNGRRTLLNVGFKSNGLKHVVLGLLNDILKNYGRTLKFVGEPKITSFMEIDNSGRLAGQFATEEEIKQSSDTVLEAIVFVKYIQYAFKEVSFKVFKSFAHGKHSNLLTSLKALEKKQPRGVLLSRGKDFGHVRSFKTGQPSK